MRLHEDRAVADLVRARCNLYGPDLSAVLKALRESEWGGCERLAILLDPMLDLTFFEEAWDRGERPSHDPTAPYPESRK